MAESQEIPRLGVNHGSAVASLAREMADKKKEKRVDL